MSETCACGKPLHYTDQRIRRAAEYLVNKLGPCVKVTTAAGSWLVPRHFIALHGLKESELPELAEQYGFASDDKPALNL